MKNKKLQDLLYDKNDILLAIVVLLIAAGLIFWRLNSIMNYPKTLDEAAGTTDTTQSEAVNDSDSKTDTSNTGSVYADGKLVKDVKVKVEGGSASGAVDCLVKAGLFTDYDDYSQVCKAAKVKPENIKATTFTFKKGSTKTIIAKKVTQ